jgi:hypothetical protein
VLRKIDDEPIALALIPFISLRICVEERCDLLVTQLSSGFAQLLVQCLRINGHQACRSTAFSAI